MTSPPSSVHAPRPEAARWMLRTLFAAILLPIGSVTASGLLFRWAAHTDVRTGWPAAVVGVIVLAAGALPLFDQERRRRVLRQGQLAGQEPSWARPAGAALDLVVTLGWFTLYADVVGGWLFFPAHAAFAGQSLIFLLGLGWALALTLGSLGEAVLTAAVRPAAPLVRRAAWAAGNLLLPASLLLLRLGSPVSVGAALVAFGIFLYARKECERLAEEARGRG